jgi:hypothetical protein
MSKLPARDRVNKGRLIPIYCIGHSRDFMHRPSFLPRPIMLLSVELDQDLSSGKRVINMGPSKGVQQNRRRL